MQMTMDSLVSDDIFNLPLVLPAQSVSQPLNLINCGGWQLEVAKGQNLPLMILENGEISLRNVADVPLLLDNNLAEGNFILNQDFVGEAPSVDRNNLKESNAVEAMSKDNVKDVILKPDIPFHKLGLCEDSEISESSLMENLVETVIMYKCKLCSFKSTEKQLLGVHIKTVHLKIVGKTDRTLKYTEETENSVESGNSSSPKNEGEHSIYMCGSCNEAFFGFTECRIHMAQHHKIMTGAKPGSPKAAVEKEKEEEKESEMKEGKKSSDDVTKDDKADNLTSTPCERTRQCPLKGCPAMFATEVGLQRHRACHSCEEREFVCYYCCTNFSKWSMCANHLWRTHNIDVELFSCPKCKYKTATRVKMKNHIQIHGDCKDFMCNKCGKMFSQQSQLRNHEVTHLKDKPEEERPRWYNKKECNQCQKIFANSKTLKKHVQAVHSKLRPYVCHVCGHSSALKNMLQMHLRQHTGEKPFSCPSCPFTTGDHNSLRRHRMRHTGVRPYRCPYCPYSSIQSISLRHHLLSWHQVDKNSLKKKDQKSSEEPVEKSGETFSFQKVDPVSKPSNSRLETGSLAVVDSSFPALEFNLRTNQVDEVTNGPFKNGSLDDGIILSSDQQGNCKEMIIQIPMSPDEISYLDSGGITIPAHELVTFD